MNGLLKVPMQFIILFIGVLVFVFYQYNTPPVFFNKVELEQLKQSEYKTNVAELEDRFITLHDEKKRAIDIMISNQSKNINDEILDQKILNLENEMTEVRTDVKALVKKTIPMLKSMIKITYLCLT